MDIVSPAIAYLNARRLLEALDPFPGGVWPRPVTKQGEQRTPEAFDTYGYIRTCVSLTDTSTDGRDGAPGVAAGILTAWLRSPDTDAGRLALLSARLWLIGALRGGVLTGANGTGIKIERVSDGVAPIPDPVNDDALLSTLRFSAAGMWS